MLEQFFECTKDDFDEKEYGIIPVAFETYLDAPQKDFITSKILAVYGDKKYNIYDNTKDVHLRDMVHEIEVGRMVAAFCNAFDEKEQLMVVAEDEEKIYELLIFGIPKMRELGEVYISEALKRLKVTAAPKVAVGVSITGDLLELSMTSEDMSKEQLLEILMGYNKKKKFYRLSNGNFVGIEGEEIEALVELKQGLNLSEAQLKQSVIKVPKYRALYLDAELKSRESLSVGKDKGFKALVRNMKTVEDNDFDIPESLTHVLREYQKRGFLWIKTLKYNGFGGILADDMGLGKSLQVICFLLSEYLEAEKGDNRRALIVCPSSLVYNWENEIQKFAPSLPAKMVIGTTAERQDIIRNIEERDILITSYDLLKRDISYYENLEFYCQVIDEAQYIKNHNTQAAKAVKLINAGFKLALTGTPIENRLSELWSIFDYLMTGFLYSYQRFREELEIPIVTNQEEYAVKRLQKMISPFILRRLKKDVLTDLPDKLEENMFARLEGEQQKLYDAHVKRLQILLDSSSEEEFKDSKIQILSELTKLRQICCDPALLYENYKQGSAKIEMCMDLIQNAVSGGHKILLFSQFTSLLEILQKRLEGENISFYSLTGSTSKEKRAKMVEQFNKNETSVFCISLKAGGTGLNLTAADIVIHFDPWWNLAVQNQATDRAHRIGQKNVVSVYKLIVQGTIEENIMKLQDKKKELADQVLSGEGMNVGSFSREDLMELLR
jgi:SNF2 family DNA or RNA helicase